MSTYVLLCGSSVELTGIFYRLSRPKKKTLSSGTKLPARRTLQPRQQHELASDARTATTQPDGPRHAAGFRWTAAPATCRYAHGRRVGGIEPAAGANDADAEHAVAAAAAAFPATSADAATYGRSAAGLVIFLVSEIILCVVCFEFLLL